MKKFGYTFWFYFKDKLNKGSLILYAVLFIAVVGVAFAISHFGGQYRDLALVQHSDTFVVTEEKVADLAGWNVHFIETEAKARELLADDEVREVFVIEGEDRPVVTMVTSGSGMLGMSLEMNETEMFFNQLLFLQHVENIMDQNELPLEVVMELSTPIEFQHEKLVDLEDVAAAYVLGMIIAFILLISVSTFGSFVANSTVTEKTSHVMEVMLAKVHPTVTMVSKILAIFSQTLLIIFSILLGVIVTELLGFLEVGEIVSAVGELISLEAVILAIVVVLFGYFMYMFMFAAVGSVATSVESLTTLLMPFSMLILIPYLLSLFVDIGSDAVGILSYIPFFAPFFLAQRFLLGYFGWLEVGIIVAIMFAFLVLTLHVAARVYMNGVSHTSEKFTMKDLRKLLAK